MAGLSLHEIAHAVAAGGAGGSIGMDSAIIAKLSRVLLLAPVALIVGLIEYKKNKNAEEKISIPVPWFMGGFILASAVGSYLQLSDNITQNLVNIAYILLGMAMAALGINVNFKVIIKKRSKTLRRSIHMFNSNTCTRMVHSRTLLRINRTEKLS